MFLFYPNIIMFGNYCSMGLQVLTALHFFCAHECCQLLPSLAVHYVTHVCQMGLVGGGNESQVRYGQGIDKM